MIENIYVAIFFIAALMFFDYFLTIKSVKLAKQGYSKHIKLETYELNPLMRGSIDKMQYSYKHFLGVIFAAIVTYFFYYLSINNIFYIGYYFMFQGMLLSIFIFINASHIRSLIIFNAVKKDSSLLSGRLKQKHLFSLKSVMADALKVFIILMFLYLLSPSYFSFGFALGPLLLVFKGRSWIKKHLKEIETKS